MGKPLTTYAVSPELGRLIGVNVGIHVEGGQIPMSFAYVVPRHYVCANLARYGFEVRKN